MQKALNYDGKGLLGINSIIRIVPQVLIQNQVILEIPKYSSDHYFQQEVAL
jgi:hypothetical protein